MIIVLFLFFVITKFQLSFFLATGAGVVYLIYGTNGNLPAINLQILGTSGAYYVGDSYDYASFAMAGVGDVNGDGYGDFIVGK
jgi:hypothetical protein